MTGAEHRKQAERLIELATKFMDEPIEAETDQERLLLVQFRAMDVGQTLALAQAHATLALQSTIAAAMA